MELKKNSTDSESPAGGDPKCDPHQRRLTVAVCLVLAAMVWAIFGQTRHFEFTNYDDPDYVFDNPFTNHGLSWQGIVQVFTHENRHEWFPVTYVSRMVDSQLYGSSAGGPHVTNVLLHAATVILLFLVLRKMTGTFWRAAFAAAVFAIHPLRVESVAWVVERKDVLSGLFFVLTLWAWLAYLQKRPANENQAAAQTTAGFAPPFRGWLPGYFLALMFFALGLMSKSMMVTLPCVLLLLDFWPLKRLPLSASGAPRLEFKAWWGLILEKVPFLPLSAAACYATMITQTNVVLTAKNSTLPWRLGNVVLAYADYLKHTIYPAGLTVVYTYSNANPPWGRVAILALILIAISVIAVAGWRKQPWLLVGWFWFVGMFAPVIDSMLATQNTRADRYSYLPQIGLCIMAAWGAAALFKPGRWQRIGLGLGAAAVLSALLVDAYIQTGYWKDSVTLWTRTLACTTNNFFAENCLGSALNNQNKWSEAVPHFERALQYKSDYPEAEVHLGVTLANLGRSAEALQHFKLGLLLKPNSAEACYHIAGLLTDQGKPEEAMPYLVRALQINPDYAEAHYDMGMALAVQGKWDEAVTHYEQAFHRTLRITDAQYITAVALADHQKWDQAIKLYQQVILAQPDSAEAEYRMGIALAALAKPTEAGQHFQKALPLATAQHNDPLAASIRSQLSTLPATTAPSPTPQL